MAAAQQTARVSLQLPKTTGSSPLPALPPSVRLAARHSRGSPSRRLLVQAVTSDKKPSTSTSTSTAMKEELEAVTKKWGLEAGLWKALRGDTGAEGGKSEEVAPGGEATPAKSNTEVAKELLGKYGPAYLVTSISLALVSFSFFYVLVDRGVDVPSLLQQLGLEVDGAGEKVGTVALAYAAHKASSPIRFPPTVLLTPIVANFFSKKEDGEET